MTRQLTPQSSLDNLKREAKRWLKALRDDNREARARLERATPNAPAALTLRHVQHAIAREYGLAGWAELKTLLAGRKSVDPVRWFIDNACPDHHVRGARAHVRAVHTALRVLEHYPEVAKDSLYTAIVCGDLTTVERFLRKPGAADEKGGPKGWQPLLYLAFTRLPLPSSNDNALAIAKLLLDRGANPNVHFKAGDVPYTPLTGVCGEGEEDRPPHPHRDALARLLLDLGAEPYDKQVVYNIHFHGRVLWFLKLIHEYSLKLGRAADWDDPEWNMLHMGGYGDGARWHLWVAIEHADRELAEWCLVHGASPTAPPSRAPRLSKRPLLADALAAGLTDIAALLVKYGARPVAVDLSNRDRALAACLAFDHPEWRTRVTEILGRQPELLRVTDVIFAAAKRDRADIVAFLLDQGMSPDIEDATKQRPLHIAAYANALNVAQLLIDRGAAIDPVESNWSNTPLAGAAYAQHREMIQLLGRYSRDVWELGYAGLIERLREVLREEPGRASAVTQDGYTPLMWLAPDDEARAIDIAKVLIANGADASLRNTSGESAADRAEQLGMFALAGFLRS